METLYWCFFFASIFYCTLLHSTLRYATLLVRFPTYPETASIIHAACKMSSCSDEREKAMPS